MSWVLTCSASRQGQLPSASQALGEVPLLRVQTWEPSAQLTPSFVAPPVRPCVCTPDKGDRLGGCRRLDRPRRLHSRDQTVIPLLDSDLLLGRRRTPILDEQLAQKLLLFSPGRGS